MYLYFRKNLKEIKNTSDISKEWRKNIVLWWQIGYANNK